MSVLLTSSKKAMAAKMLAKKMKAKSAEKAKREAHTAAARRAAAEPPLSSSSTAVWYWNMDTIPTSLFYDMDKNEVWCNGYILETNETFDDELSPGGLISFGLYLSELGTMHEGKICRMLANGPNPQGYAYILYVDGCMIPEHVTSGVSADVTTGYALAGQTTSSTRQESPPRYDDVINDGDNFPFSFESMSFKKDN